MENDRKRTYFLTNGCINSDDEDINFLYSKSYFFNCLPTWSKFLYSQSWQNPHFRYFRWLSHWYFVNFFWESLWIWDSNKKLILIPDIPGNNITMVIYVYLCVLRHFFVFDLLTIAAAFIIILRTQFIKNWMGGYFNANVYRLVSLFLSEICNFLNGQAFVKCAQISD